MKTNLSRCIVSVICVFTALVLSETPCSSQMPDGFVDVRKIIPSIVLDMRYVTSHNFVGAPIDGYEAAKCILTTQAAYALKKVQQDLKMYSLSLKVYDCYRSQRAVNHFIKWAKNHSDFTRCRGPTASGSGPCSIKIA